MEHYEGYVHFKEVVRKNRENSCHKIAASSKVIDSKR